MTLRVLVYVQHLLGIGHLARIQRIARSLVARGADVCIARGGVDAGLPDIEGAEIFQLAPARVTAEEMSVLLHADGRPFTDADQRERCDQLLALLMRFQPDVLLVEAFPFGRRQMRFELLPLLTKARELNVSVIAASIRDILQNNWKPGRAEETVAAVKAYFDLVLVHGEEASTPLGLTFPLADAIAAKTRYTGLVGPPSGRSVIHAYDVVVSAGGGSVGSALLQCAIAAAPLSRLGNGAWLVLTGKNAPGADIARLEGQARSSRARITIAQSVPDLPAHLRGAKLSISQAGYNTVADVLAVGCASVLVPFARGGETEQTARAEALAAARRAVMIAEDNLDPMRLAAAIDEALALPQPKSLQLDGASRSADILFEALVNHRTAGGRLESRTRMLSDGA
jgi:predicted glycosyltransferase